MGPEWERAVAEIKQTAKEDFKQFCKRTNRSEEDPHSAEIWNRARGLVHWVESGGNLADIAL